MGKAVWIAGAGLLAAAGANLWLTRRAERRYPPRGKFVVIDGVRLHYLDEGAGAPILLLHGNGATADDFAASGLVDLLAADHRVIAFDRPGSGYSARPRDWIWTVEAQASLLRRALHEIGAADAVIVGHSWGALVALAMALDFPRETAALVLLSGYYFPSRRADVALMRGASLPVLADLAAWTVLPLLARLLSRPLLSRIFAPVPVPARFRNAFPLALALRPSQTRAIALDTALMMPGAATLLPRHREIAVPVIIIGGGGDRIVDTAEQSARLHAALAGSDFRFIEGAGHMLHYAATRQVADAIRAARRMARRRDD